VLMLAADAIGDDEVVRSLTSTAELVKSRTQLCCILCCARGR